MGRIGIMLAIAAVASGCGRIAFDPIAAPPDASPSLRVHAYVFTAAQTEIQIFDVAADGSLTLAAGSPYNLDVPGLDLHGDASGAHLYVATYDGTANAQTIRTLSIDRETGLLTQLASQPAGEEPQVVVLHPNGRWLYTSSWGANPYVYGYVVAADGTLSAMPGSPFSHAGVDSSYIGIDPKGRWLYVSSDDHFVYGFAVSATDGSLTAVPAIRWASNDSGPYCVLVDATGRFGWVAPDTSGGVPGFTINQADGTLTTTPGSKFGSHGNTTMDATLDRTGTRAFFANQGDGSFDVTAYAIDSSTGALTDLPGSPVPTTAESTALTVAASPVSDDVYFAGGSLSQPKIIHYRATSAGIQRTDEVALPSRPGRLTIVATP